ncbi:cell division protein FtsX [Pullulanibacillus pueri]|uniref:DUF2627 domain-containing protein n=1 Tax=Pullulanibacillus pueri TaxID=1437324 RepID=A0A8J3EM79_9BACL|nr:DUF2627 domain-containing protein [Pullulanibacillus pueri]MBM7681608.1 cell division protein FtsX [Pullulanibacillus pueri]GGH79474.1 hypothetical protein GCM10007096_14450 [Pullulanibacillus pueri]
MAKYMALIIIVIPIVLAVIGVKLMRDTVFDIINTPFTNLWLQFITGLLLFIIGIAFIGGWIFYRDRKRNYVAKRFKKKK